MIQLEREGVTFTESRRQGLTINDMLRSWQKAQTAGVLFWKEKPQLPSVQLPDLYFEEITYFKASCANELNFVVAVGRDEDRFTLVINDKIAINERLVNLKVVELFRSSGTGLTLFCRTEDHTGKISLIHVGEQTEITPIIENQDRISEVEGIGHITEDQGFRFTNRVVGVSDNTTTFVYYNNSGEILKRFSVDKSLELGDIEYYKTSQDFTTVWIVPEQRDDEVKGEVQTNLRTYYRDSELIAEHVLSESGPFKDGAIVFNSDLSSFISVERNTQEDEPRVKIQKDGRVLERTDYRLPKIRANENLSLAAVEFAISDENDPNPKSVIFYITPDKQGWTDPYDGKRRAVLEFSDHTILVSYERDGIARTLKIETGEGSGNPGETTIIEESAA